MDDRRQTPSDGKSSHCLCQGELKMWNIIHNKKNYNVSFIIEHMLSVYIVSEYSVGIL